MTVLSKLYLSDKTEAAMLTSPEAKLRGNSLRPSTYRWKRRRPRSTVETFIRRAMGWVDDPETGERVRKEVPVRFRTRFWKDEQGSYMLDVRYGNRRLEIESKKPAIEVGEAKNLIPTSAASY